MGAVVPAACPSDVDSDDDHPANSFVVAMDSSGMRVLRSLRCHRLASTCTGSNLGLRVAHFQREPLATRLRGRPQPCIHRSSPKLPALHRGASATAAARAAVSAFSIIVLQLVGAQQSCSLVVQSSRAALWVAQQSCSLVVQCRLTAFDCRGSEKRGSSSTSSCTCLHSLA